LKFIISSTQLDTFTNIFRRTIYTTPYHDVFEKNKSMTHFYLDFISFVLFMKNAKMKDIKKKQFGFQSKFLLFYFVNIKIKNIK
jgi:hypothetical protein